MHAECANIFVHKKQSNCGKNASFAHFLLAHKDVLRVKTSCFQLAWLFSISAVDR
jgi:hypothetical protein